MTTNRQPRKLTVWTGRIEQTGDRVANLPRRGGSGLQVTGAVLAASRAEAVRAFTDAGAYLTPHLVRQAWNDDSEEPGVVAATAAAGRGVPLWQPRQGGGDRWIPWSETWA